TVTAMADAWVALRDARQNDDERKETEETVNRFVMAFTTIEPLSGAWGRFDHVRAEGKRVGMAVNVPVQAVEAALKNRLDVRWKPLLDRVPKVARELPASELAALGPTVAHEREATLVALAAEVGALRQEFDRWPTVTRLTTAMGSMASQLVTLEKATTQVRALRERQAALRAKWGAAGDDVALQVAVLDEAAREKVRFYDAPDDLPAALGAQFRQALRITVPAQVSVSATQPRILGQTTAPPGTRVVPPVTPRQAPPRVIEQTSVAPVRPVVGQSQGADSIESSPVVSGPRQGVVTTPNEKRPASPSSLESELVQRLVKTIDAMVGANSRREVTREAWLEACRQERALTSGRESDPTLKQLRRVRDRLVGAANANALRWGTEAFFEGGSELGRAVIGEVRSRADELRRGADAALKERQPWGEWEEMLTRRGRLEKHVAELRLKVLRSPSLLRAGSEFDTQLRETIDNHRTVVWASDVCAWLMIMRTNLIVTQADKPVGNLRDAVTRRLESSGRLATADELLAIREQYVSHLKEKSIAILNALAGRPENERDAVDARMATKAWRRLQDSPEDDWLASFALEVATQFMEHDLAAHIGASEAARIGRIAEEVKASRATTAAFVDPKAHVHTTVVIQGVPGFSRALTLQRAIQQIDGVVDAKADGYERGLLTLDVVHEARVAIPAALMRADEL
ncbi:MAG: hypothetical protein KGS10_15985, partial [Chloroflexi bacterium]|nr:hypothetical protein [Chloroflexota bacterium]